MLFTPKPKAVSAHLKSKQILLGFADSFADSGGKQLFCISSVVLY